jgi:DNA-binding NarL/FixJ family response regulator
MEALRYAIADDHKIFRQGLRHALAGDTGLRCVGEAGNGEELLSLLEKDAADVVLMDLKMPVMDGIECTKALREKQPTTKVIILTMQDDEQLVLHLLEAGAGGYLVKNAEPEEIQTALRTVCETGYYFNDLVSTALLRTVVHKQKPDLRFKPDVQLTEKEREILTLICNECTNAEIARQVFLSPRTVEGIRSGLLEKVGVRNTAGLVLYAVRSGLVQ